MKIVTKLAFIFGSISIAGSYAGAAQLSSCDGNTFVCNIFEEQNIDISALGGAISGDLVLLEGGVVSDVFRIFNDFVDTGGGTGIGLTASFFSVEQGNLPDPSTYSSNVAFIQETGNVTTFVGNGDTYNLNSPAPEPSGLALFCIGAIALAAKSGSRRVRAMGRASIPSIP